MKKTQDQLFKLQFSVFQNLSNENLFEVYLFVVDELLESRTYATTLMKKKIRTGLEEELFKAVSLFKKNLNKNKNLFFPTYAMFFLKEVMNEFVDKYPNSIKK
jgi:hypothetical protein